MTLYDEWKHFIYIFAIKIEENQVSGGATHEQVKLKIRGKRKQPKDTNEWICQMDPSIA
jgi:hypothetical protein